MQADDLDAIMTMTAAAASGVAVLLCLRFRASLASARRALKEAQRLALARGQSMLLAAQELRSIAAALHADAAPARELPAAGAGLQLVRLAEDITAVANDTEARDLQVAPARLGPLVDRAVATVSAEILPAVRHWKVDPALRALTVKADIAALGGALTALLRRAASHSRDGDLVALRWVMASETVSIVVEDEGDGLAGPDLAPAPGMAVAGPWGFDLGLSTARTLAAAHGGEVRLETAPGIGARAWLTLPRARLLEAA
jgi:signal transduction histidine kinase